MLVAELYIYCHSSTLEGRHSLVRLVCFSLVHAIWSFSWCLQCKEAFIKVMKVLVELFTGRQYIENILHLHIAFWSVCIAFLCPCAWPQCSVLGKFWKLALLHELVLLPCLLQISSIAIFATIVLWYLLILNMFTTKVGGEFKWSSWRSLLLPDQATTVLNLPAWFKYLVALGKWASVNVKHWLYCQQWINLFSE